MELFEMKMDKNLVIIILCISVNSCCAITNHGSRHIPIHGWRAASTGEQPGAYFDRDEYRNYRRNPVTFFDQDRNTEVRQPSDSYFNRDGGREIRNTDDFPKPQLPWEEALRHSVYLTLVRDRIDSLLVKQAGSDRQNLNVHESTKDVSEMEDVNLWRNIQKAQFKQNSKDKGPVFGDIAILSRGKLIESLQGFEFIEDEDIKECIECHLFTARHNEVEAERILTSRCDGPDCSNQRIKALWTVRRIRHRNPEGDDPPFMYELMFSIASPKPDRTNLNYNEPSQTFSIQEADKLKKPPRKHERKGKFIFQDEKTQDYNRGYHSTQETTAVQSYGDVRTEGPPWYDGFNARRHQQQSTEHPPYVNRYPEFYPDYQESSTRLNTGEKYPTRDEEFKYINPPYIESSVQPNDKAKYREQKKIINVKSEELLAPENVRSHKALKDFKIPTITHLHHHYYLNSKGVPVMKPSKFENHNNFEVYLPNGYNKGTTASNQNTPYSEDEEYSNDQHSGIDEPMISDSNPKKAHINTNSSPQVSENRVTIPFHTTNTMSLQTETTEEEEEATTVNSIGKVTLSESQFYRKPVKSVDSTQHEVKNRQRKLRPTKPFRPSPVDERTMFSELDPLYMPTSSTPTEFTSKAQVINLKNPHVEVNNFSEEKPIYEDNQEDYPDDNPFGPGHVSLEDDKEGTGEISDSSHANLTEENQASSNQNHEEMSEDDSDQTLESANENQGGSSDDTPEETNNNNQSESIQTPLETNEEEKYTEPAVTEKITLLSVVGTTIENIYLPEFSDSNENGDHNNNNNSSSGERTTTHVQATQPSYTTQYQDVNEYTTRKINDHRIQRKPYKPNRRVKLQKNFSDLIKSQLPSPRSGGTTLPYGSAVTAVYEEKMDTVPELENNATHSPSIVRPFRKLRQRTTPPVSTTETTGASTATDVYVERNLETEPQSYNSTSAPLNVPYRKLRQRHSKFIPTTGTSPAPSLLTEAYEENTKSETELPSNSTFLTENVPVRQVNTTYIPSTGSVTLYAVSSVVDGYDEKKYTDSETQDNSKQKPLVNTPISIKKLRQRHSTLLPTTGISDPHSFTLVTEKYEENINSEKNNKMDTISEPQDNSTQIPLATTPISGRKLKQRHSTLSQTTEISTPYASSSVTEKYEESNHSEKVDTLLESQDNSTQTPLANTTISIKEFRQRHSTSLPTTGYSTPYAFLSATENYEEKNQTEKMDTVSESVNNSAYAPISPIRRLRLRNSTFIPPRISTSIFIPQRVSNSTFKPQTNSRHKYQRKLGTWTTSHLRPKLLTEKPSTSTTEVTTEATTDFTDEGSKMTTVYDDVMKTVMDQNTTIYYKEIDKHNETTANKTDKNNHNRYSDSEVNASEHSTEITDLPSSPQNDSTEANKSVTISETTEITSISEEVENSPTIVSETIATVETTETPSKPYSKSDEEIFTPLTKKSFVTSISLKLGNRTRPYFLRSTEYPRKGSLRFTDQLKLTENTTFMADLLSRFNMDDTMKAKIFEVNHAGKEIKIHKAEETSDQKKIQRGVVKVDNVTRQIIQHGKFIK